ncbi:MAG: hypothetical protein ABIK39_06605, partial [candidate division WOR-3 bacterium]
MWLFSSKFLVESPKLWTPNHKLSRLGAGPVKSESKSFFSLLFGLELRITGKGTPENLFRPLLPTIPPFDFPFELKQDFNIKLSTKPELFSTKGFTTLVVGGAAPRKICLQIKLF